MVRNTSGVGYIFINLNGKHHFLTVQKQKQLYEKAYPT